MRSNLKRILACSAAFLITIAAIAKQKICSLEEIVQQTDLIVVARLDGSTLKGERPPESKRFHYWKGQLAVSSVIRGAAKKGENLKLEWMIDVNPVCIRSVDLSVHSDQHLIWLLRTGKNGSVNACSVLPLKQWWELEKLLNK